MPVLLLISQLENQSLSSNRITSGIKGLDGMLDGKGCVEGNSILVSGSERQPAVYKNLQGPFGHCLTPLNISSGDR